MSCLTAYDKATGELTDFCFNGAFSSTASSELSSISTMGDVDTLWLIICGCMVFFMQLGFTMLEVGAVRSKNAQNILFKNLADACLGALVWFFIGWPLAYGVLDDDPSEFIGGKDFVLDDSKDYVNFFFQWCFAATAATIVSGAVAERITIHGYFLYTVVITGFIYPVVVYWVWSGSGWLSYGMDEGIMDFAGSGVVHMVGGFSGLMGAYVAGPRQGKCLPHSVPFQAFGTLILWFGWYGFNCGSTLGAQGAMNLAARVAVTTTIGAASGGISAMMLARYFEEAWSIPRMCNGILAGLVSITGPCAVVGTGSSLAIGGLGGIVYYASSALVLKIGIDDPLEASAVHGFCGIWGVLAVGIFSTDDFVADAFGDVNEELGSRFGYQLLAAFTIMVWTIGTSFIMFKLIDVTVGLRVDEAAEKRGLDKEEHGGNAWNITRRMSTSFSGSGMELANNNREEQNETQENNDVEKDDMDEFDEPATPFTPPAQGQTGDVKMADINV